jgi:hypothetical protein
MIILRGLESAFIVTRGYGIEITINVNLYVPPLIEAINLTSGIFKCNKIVGECKNSIVKGTTQLRILIKDDSN